MTRSTALLLALLLLAPVPAGAQNPQGPRPRRSFTYGTYLLDSLRWRDNCVLALTSGLLSSCTKSPVGDLGNYTVLIASCDGCFENPSRSRKKENGDQYCERYSR